MENYHLVSLWVINFNNGEAIREIEALKLRYPWLKCEQSYTFIKKMSDDLPRFLHIVQLQEQQNAMLRYEVQYLRGYIKANGMADTILIDDIAKKFNLDL